MSIGQAKWKNKMKAQGRCVVCGEDRDLSKIYCNKHMIHEREKTRIKRNSEKRYFKAKSYYAEYFL